MIPNARENKAIDSLISKFHELNTVTLSLQKETTTCADARLLFDEVSEQYPFTKPRLGPNAAIVANPIYESGIIKILNLDLNSLSDEEKEAVRNLKKEHG